MVMKDLITGYIGQEILIILDAHQLNLMGQTFRPVFVGQLTSATDGFITLSPVTIKMINAPEYQFPTPLRFPLERIVVFTPNFSAKTVFPLS